ncbi:MAG: hypothetical protein E5X96_10255, partial [Mesorhizobium sp.]
MPTSSFRTRRTIFIGQFPSSGSPFHGNGKPLCFFLTAIPDGKPFHTFPGIALAAATWALCSQRTMAKDAAAMTTK